MLRRMLECHHERKATGGRCCKIGNHFYRKGLEKAEAIVPVYTALFVNNVPDLISQFPPKHKRVLAHHSTIAF